MILAAEGGSSRAAACLVHAADTLKGGKLSGARKIPSPGAAPGDGFVAARQTHLGRDLTKSRRRPPLARLTVDAF